MRIRIFSSEGKGKQKRFIIVLQVNRKSNLVRTELKIFVLICGRFKVNKGNLQGKDVKKKGKQEAKNRDSCPVGFILFCTVFCECG